MPPAPKATEDASVPVSVKVLLTVSVLPSATVSVAEVAGAVMASLFTEVAVAAPIAGAVRLGLVEKTKDPEPVSSVTKDLRFSADGVVRKVRVALLMSARAAVPEPVKYGNLSAALVRPAMAVSSASIGW